MKFVFASATFFWVGCSDDSSSTSAPLYGCPDGVCENPSTSASIPGETSNSSSSVKSSSSSSDYKIPMMSATEYGAPPIFNTSSSSADTSSAFDSSSSNYDPDDWIPPMSSTAYGIQPTYNNSSSSADTSSAFDSSSSNYDPDDWIPPMSSTAYGIQPTYNNSSSSVESSSSSIDDEGIPSMSGTVYGPSIPCYSTTEQNDAGKSFDIIECQNGEKFLKNSVIYGESIKEELPEGVSTDVPQRTPFLATNCSETSICVDGVDAEGNPTGGCFPTLECPPKDE